LHHDVAACPIDVVILVGDQATTVEHFIERGIGAFFQGLMQS
jgi:hypothetical protein